MKFSINQSAFLSKIFACELTIKAEVYAIFCFSANASSSSTTSWCCCCCKNFPTFHLKANKINQKQMTANGCEHTEREREREHARAHQHYIGKFPFLAFPFNCLWPCYVFVLVFFCFVSFRSLLLRFSCCSFCCRCRDGQTNLWKRKPTSK